MIINLNGMDNFSEPLSQPLKSKWGSGDEVAKVLVIIYFFEQVTIRFAGTFLLFPTAVNYYIISNYLTLAIASGHPPSDSA